MTDIEERATKFIRQLASRPSLMNPEKTLADGFIKFALSEIEPYRKALAELVEAVGESHYDLSPKHSIPISYKIAAAKKLLEADND